MATVGEQATHTSVVRIRPVPRCEPQADDELPGAVAPPDLATGVQVRRAPGRSRGRAGDRPRVRGAVTESTRGGPEPKQQASPRPALVGKPTPVPGPRDLRAAARQLLGTCVEVIGGFRPITQLRPYCAPERFDAIVNRLLRPTGTGRGHGATRGSVVVRGSQPGRPAHAAAQDRVVLRRVQICDVSEGIAEVAVVMSRRGKVWAMALRLERSRGRWQCMHLEVL